jgi:uncharacterized protein YcbK (DUF882 family)
MTYLAIPSRRGFLRLSATLALAGTGTVVAPRARAVPASSRSLAFVHTHTRENISLVYAMRDTYLTPALNRLNHFLRDHYTGDVGTIDPQLFDILHLVTRTLNAKQPYQVISGYRCAATNARLRGASKGGVAKRSLHMSGKAIDVRLPGVPLAELRDAALSLQAGGVGYYPRDRFVHIDTGRVRSWGS